MGLSGRQRHIDVLLVGAATAYAAFALNRAPAWAVDDAWIVARYAQNFVATGHFSWNVGEPPVEGFTSLLGMVVAVIATALHLSAVKAAIAVSSAAYLASASLVLWLGRELRAPTPAAGILALTYVTMAEHATHATSGLETELYLSLALVLASTTVRALRGGSPVPFAIAGFLLAITRPEGMAAAAIALVLVRRRQAFLWFGAPLVVVLLWRWTTFGSLVPNTYYAKRAALNDSHLKDLWKLADEHFVDFIVVSVATVLVGLRRPFARVERAVALLAIAIIAVQTIAYARSEPVMDYSKRFAMNDVPWLVVITLVATSAGLRARRLAVLFAVALVTNVQRGARHEGFESMFTSKYEKSTQNVIVPAAKWIETHTRKDATIAVYPDAGILPYMTKRRTIDFGLLNDARLARAHSVPEVVAYFYAIKPDVLVMLEREPNKLYDPGADAIVADPRFDPEYEIVIHRDSYRLYARRHP